MLKSSDEYIDLHFISEISPNESGTELNFMLYTNGESRKVTFETAIPFLDADELLMLEF